MSDFKYYDVTVKNIDVKSKVFAKSELDALNSLLTKMSGIYDVDLVHTTTGVITYLTEVDQAATDEFRKGQEDRKAEADTEKAEAEDGPIVDPVGGEHPDV